jgi:hypothetical protein
MKLLPQFGTKFLSHDPFHSTTLGAAPVLAPKMLSVTRRQSASACSSVRGSLSIIHFVLGNSGLGVVSGVLGDIVLQLSLRPQ